MSLNGHVAKIYQTTCQRKETQMARGRFISNTLGASKKFAKLTSDSHRLAYVLLVTHADVEGRVEAHPRILNGYAYTMLGWSDEQVQAALEDMHRVGLIILYEVDGDQYAEVASFDAHNKIRKDRESPSAIPCVPDGMRSNSGVTPTKLRSSDGVTPDYDGSTPSQVEVEVQVEDKVEGEVEDRAHESSEERMQQRLAGGTSSNDTHRVRATLRRINPDFAKQNEDSMTAWARWSNDDLQHLWEYSHPKNHKDGQTKRRSWIFKDLLNEERFAPPRALIVKKDPDAWMDEYGLREMLEEIDREKEERQNAETQ